MGGDLSALDLDTEYRSVKDDPVRTFYVRCLREARFYRRAVGYFRSSVYAVIGPAVMEFARRGGKIQLICSPELDPEDVQRITEGYAQRKEGLAESLLQQFEGLLADERTTFPARTLATLVATGVLEIKIAERRDRKGLYHEKIGIFEDAGMNHVSFKGSANETWSGWHDSGNFESIEVFCSWRGGLEASRVTKHLQHFESLWSGSDPDIEVVAVPETVTEYIKRFSAKSLDELEREALLSSNQSRKALPHQQLAVDNWKANGRRGIFEHATGSGKTFTAIVALREHLAAGKPAIVLVPSELLLEQWAKEIQAEVPGAVIVLAGAGHNEWKNSSTLTSMTSNDEGSGHERVIIAMMQTAATSTFARKIRQGDHLLVIADEVHQIGSRKNSEFLQINAGARLGLSATPYRYGDPEGTARIFAYFGPVIEPKINLQDAIKAGRLVEYTYHPHPINLSAVEAEEWKRQTLEIKREIARGSNDDAGHRVLSDRAKKLLINRSRIAKKAGAKVSLATRIICAEYEAGQSWLVYCEDHAQLQEVMTQLRSCELRPIEYHSKMVGDRVATMSWFRTYGGILVSIKCLDEGVDIPAVSHALILASSQNPRQFIQRRGRVLRKSAGKTIAVIHDAVVVPLDPEDEHEQLGLLRAELQRSVEFANHALNRMAAAELRDIAMRMGIDPDNMDVNEGEEEDEEYE